MVCRYEGYASSAGGLNGVSIGMGCQTGWSVGLKGAPQVCLTAG